MCVGGWDLVVGFEWGLVVGGDLIAPTVVRVRMRSERCGLGGSWGVVVRGGGGGGGECISE